MTFRDRFDQPVKENRKRGELNCLRLKAEAYRFNVSRSPIVKEL